MKLKELLEQNPASSFSMMTPGGYVCLTTEQAQKLLQGEPAHAHLGFPGSQYKIPAEELLEQQVDTDTLWQTSLGCIMGMTSIEMVSPEMNRPAPGMSMEM